MYRFIVSAALAAVVASSSLAFADQSSGRIKAFDAKAMTLTLQDGTTYTLPKDFKDPGLATGERVQITWSMQGPEYMASTVTMIQ